MTPLLRSTACILLATSTLAADQDNDVEWNGLSHLDWQDRTPVVPVRNESFRVRFQSYRNDLTAASVRQYAPGSSVRVFPAAIVAQRGPYDVWESVLDARDVPNLSYDIEVTDGTDTDYIGASGVGDAAPSGGPIQLDFVAFTHAPLGSTPVTGGTVFRVWAPNAPTAHVRGSFNGWSLAHPMTKVGEDFYAFVAGAAAGDAYKYYFSHSGTWKPDAFARRYDPANGDNSIVVDPRGYAWQSAPFGPPPFEQMVCYQLHVGSFAGRNDPFGPAPNPSRFVDVAARASHLAELGVNVVYLNPVIEWPGDHSGGYNPVSLTTIESALGTPNELKAMVDALHQRGIAVVLDVVWNHLDGGANFLTAYTGGGAADNIYFDSPPVSTPWGPQLDLDRARVRQFVLDAAVMLLDEYRFDGFRVDGISALSWGSQAGASNQLLRDLNALVDNRYEDKLVLAEVFGDDPWFTRPRTAGGLGFDAQYHTAFKDAVRGATFDAAFGDPNVSALSSAATRSGTQELQGSRVFNYFELHDDAWPINGHERAVRVIDPTAPHDDRWATGRTKLAHGLTLLSRGIPAILHGTEWLEDEGWELNRLDWAHKAAYAGVFRFYRDLIGLRTSRPALFAGAGASGYHTNEGANVFAFERWHAGGASFVVVANFGNQDFTGGGAYRVGLPRAGQWAVALNSEAGTYAGRGVGSTGSFQAQSIPYDGFGQSIALELPAHGFLLLEHAPPPAGTNYCTPGTTGAVMGLAAGSSISVAANDFTIEASPVANSFGFFFFGDTQHLAPLGDCARVCIGASPSLRRLPPRLVQAGVASFALDLATAPGNAITGGTSWNFQYWFRETATCSSGFDLSDGLRVLFQQ